MMGLFAGFLTSVFSALFGILGTYFTKKVAFGGAVVTILLGVVAAFYATMVALLNGLSAQVTNTTFLMVFHSVLPSNFASCLAIMLGSDVAAFLYRHQVMTIKAFAQS